MTNNRPETPTSPLVESYYTEDDNYIRNLSLENLNCQKPPIGGGESFDNFEEEDEEAKKNKPRCFDLLNNVEIGKTNLYEEVLSDVFNQWKPYFPLQNPSIVVYTATSNKEEAADSLDGSVTYVGDDIPSNEQHPVVVIHSEEVDWPNDGEIKHDFLPESPIVVVTYQQSLSPEETFHTSIDEIAEESQTQDPFQTIPSSVPSDNASVKPHFDSGKSISAPSSINDEELYSLHHDEGTNIQEVNDELNYFASHPAEQGKSPISKEPQNEPVEKEVECLVSTETKREKQDTDCAAEPKEEAEGVVSIEAQEEVEGVAPGDSYEAMEDVGPVDSQEEVEDVVAAKPKEEVEGVASVDSQEEVEGVGQVDSQEEAEGGGSVDSQEEVEGGGAVESLEELEAVGPVDSQEEVEDVVAAKPKEELEAVGPVDSQEEVEDVGSVESQEEAEGVGSVDSHAKAEGVDLTDPLNANNAGESEENSLGSEVVVISSSLQKTGESMSSEEANEAFVEKHGIISSSVENLILSRGESLLNKAVCSNESNSSYYNEPSNIRAKMPEDALLGRVKIAQSDGKELLSVLEMRQRELEKSINEAAANSAKKSKLFLLPNKLLMSPIKCKIDLCAMKEEHQSTPEYIRSFKRSRSLVVYDQDDVDLYWKAYVGVSYSRVFKLKSSSLGPSGVILMTQLALDGNGWPSWLSNEEKSKLISATENEQQNTPSSSTYTRSHSGSFPRRPTDAGKSSPPHPAAQLKPHPAANNKRLPIRSATSVHSNTTPEFLRVQLRKTGRLAGPTEPPKGSKKLSQLPTASSGGDVASARKFFESKSKN